MTPLGLYIHIPFCKSKCAYCDFYSLPNCEEKMDAYVSALTNHLKEVAPRMKNQTVDTVYFGGGTPSYLGQERLCHLLKTVKKCYRVASDAEITLEANPDSAGEVKTLRKLRRAGFNRISLGVQSTDDALLKRIGNSIDEETAGAIIAQLYDAKLVTENEAALIRAAIGRNALALPISGKDVLRAAVFRNMLVQVFRNAEGGGLE